MAVLGYAVVQGKYMMHHPAASLHIYIKKKAHIEDFRAQPPDPWGQALAEMTQSRDLM